jgi:hypothetical protein
MTPTKNLALICTAVFALAGSAYVLLAMRTPAGLYAEYTSPDGALRVVVTREASWGGVAPGQGGDAPGVVVLLNEAGTELRRANLESVNQVQNVSWGDASVRVTPFITWELPAPKP